MDDGAVVVAGALTTMFVAMVAGLRWLFTLEGRIDSHEQVCAERQNTLASKLNEIKATAAQQGEKLDKQDAKLDRLVEHLLR